MRTGRFGKIANTLGERTPWWLCHCGKASLWELRNVGPMPARSESVLAFGHSCRPASREELPACCRITGIDVHEYYRRFDAGDVCFSVFAQDRPVNIDWERSGACYVRGMGYGHNGVAADKYVYGIMTDSAERGKGLYKNCLVNLSAHLFAGGAERIVQMVAEGNTPVLGTLPRLGYKKTHDIRHTVVLGIKRTSVTDLTSDQTVVRWFVFNPNNRFVI